jgi:hypothetical protein
VVFCLAVSVPQKDFIGELKCVPELFQLDSPLELIHGFLESSLVQQKFAALLEKIMVSVCMEMNENGRAWQALTSNYGVRFFVGTL